MKSIIKADSVLLISLLLCLPIVYAQRVRVPVVAEPGSIPFRISSSGSGLVQGEFEGTYRVRDNFVEVNVQRGQLYVSSSIADAEPRLLNYVKFGLWNEEATGWKVENSAPPLILRLTLKPGEHHDLRNLHFLLPKDAATDLTRRWLVVEIQADPPERPLREKLKGYTFVHGCKDFFVQPCVQMMAGGQGPSFDPLHKMRYIHYTGNDLVSPLLSGLARDYAVTIGFETDPRQSRRYVDVEAYDANLTDMLNAVVRAAPQYQWRASGKAIDVLPADGGSTFLETRISVFRVQEVGQRGAMDQLMNLPEVQAAMKAKGLKLVGYKAAEEMGRLLSLSLEGVTVREVLHEIVKGSGTKFWVLQRGERGEVWVGAPKR